MTNEGFVHLATERELPLRLPGRPQPDCEMKEERGGGKERGEEDTKRKEAVREERPERRTEGRTEGGTEGEMEGILKV